MIPIGGIDQVAQRQPAELGVVVGKARHHAGCRHAGDRDLVRVGQIDVGELDRAARRIASSEPWAPAISVIAAVCSPLVISTASLLPVTAIVNGFVMTPPWPSSTVAV